MIRKSITVFFLFVLLTYTHTYTQEIPPLINYTPEKYNAENQNWGISQSENKQMYIANNSGLLEFNGASWQLYNSPNNSILRAVKVIDDKIYTGCYMEFGFWKKDNTGHLTYKSLSKQIQSELLEDEEFWNIIYMDQWILFQSLNRIYIYDIKNDDFKIIRSKTQLQKAFKINNTIYFQKMKDGLYKIEKGNTVLITNDPIVKENIIVGAFEEKSGLLFITQEKGFFKLQKNTLHKWKTTSDTLLSEISVYSCIKTKNNHFILGSISHGVYELDQQGNTLLNIDQEKGLNNNTVLTIFEDIDKNIWLGLDNGLSCLNFDAPFAVYNDKKGKLGTTYASIQYNNYLYIGTNQGLFYKPTNSKGDFKLIKGTEGQVWNLQIIENTLFCGHNSGTYTIKDRKATLISTIPGTWKLSLSPSSNKTIFQGNYTGFSILKKSNNQWKFSHQIKGFDISSRYFEFVTQNKILVTHEYKGVYLLDLNESQTNFTNIDINPELKGEKSSLIKYQNEIFYFYNKGVYKYNVKYEKFEQYKLFDKGFTNNEEFNSGKLVTTKDSKLWGFTNNNIIYFSPGKLNTTPDITKIYLPIELRKDYTGFENISLLNDEKYLLGTSFGFLIINTKKLQQKKYNIQLNQITKRKLNNNNEIVPLTDKNNFEFENNNLEFSFSVPSFEKFTEVTYKYILEGRHYHWTEWTESPTASFKNLPYGDYTFRAKAKIGNTVSTNEITYHFNIDRPWYLSNSMIAFYIFFFAVISLIIHSIYQRFYKKQKQQLLDKKQREFERSQLESEKEIMKLRNEKLRNDIEGKNRELAASTMSIIKKNEFLNSIKKELTDLENNDLIKPVIKIIDKNLNSNSDWKLFQEAFNNADKDFLKKLKNRYPKLTPNDLKLCAYLRLNLSSKEIAPLLNISYKSVEIKRYRLRKKMDLDKNDNLTHHILNI